MNKNLLYSEIVKNGFTWADVAKEIGVNPVTLYRKVKGESDFTRAEVQKIKAFLNLDFSDVEKIFFGEDFA